MWPVFLLILSLMTSIMAENKYKSLHCNIYDQAVGEFPLCRIKAINRYRNSISVTFRAKQTINKIMVRVETLQKANGWRPFLYNLVNMCSFLENRHHFLGNIGFSLLEPYLKGNPFRANDTIMCEGLHMDFDKFRLRFPVETGEYALRLSFYHNGVMKISLNGSMEYSNYKEH